MCDSFAAPMSKLPAFAPSLSKGWLGVAHAPVNCEFPHLEGEVAEWLKAAVC